MIPQGRQILLTGATGYIGGRLLPRLESLGHRVRCLARRPADLASRVGAGTEVVQGDVLEPATLPAAMAGADTAFYLVHALHPGDGDDKRDQQAAAAFADAARRAGVRRIVYLGALGDPRDDLSPHLRSRHEVGQVLRTGGVPVVEFRASIILGTGSVSFELIRALVERLPAMVCPRWVETPAQPIHVEDVLDYLVAGIDVPAGTGRVFEVGGPDRASYGGIMREYAQLRGLRRVMVRVPVLTPRLSGLWLSLVAPRHAGVGRELIEGLRSPTIIQDPSALAQFPTIRPIGLTEALRRAGGIEPAGAPVADERPADDGSAAAGCGPLRGLGRGVGRLVRQARDGEHHALSLVSRRGRERGWQPAVDVSETSEAVVVTAELPGVEPDQVEVALEGDILTLRGSRDPSPASAGDVVLRGERVAGPFDRAIPLPAAVTADDVSAEFEEGILRVRLGKRPAPEPRLVPVKG